MWFGSEGGSFGVLGVDFGLVLSFLSFPFFFSWKVVYAIWFLVFFFLFFSLTI